MRQNLLISPFFTCCTLVVLAHLLLLSIVIGQLQTFKVKAARYSLQLQFEKQAEVTEKKISQKAPAASTAQASQQNPSEANQLDEVDPTHYIKPHYPLSAKRRGQQGIVALKLLVQPTGKIANIQLEKSSGFAVLDQSAMSAVKKWIFPKQYFPQEQWIRKTVEFKIQ